MKHFLFPKSHLKSVLDTHRRLEEDLWAGRTRSPPAAVDPDPPSGRAATQQQQQLVLSHLATILSRLCTTPAASRVFPRSPPAPPTLTLMRFYERNYAPSSAGVFSSQCSFKLSSGCRGGEVARVAAAAVAAVAAVGVTDTFFPSSHNWRAADLSEWMWSGGNWEPKWSE